jgi:RND family efflux transporter MFP subunit
VNAGGSDPVLTTIRSQDPIRLFFNVDERLLQRLIQRKEAEGTMTTGTLAALPEGKVTFTFALDGEKEFKHQGVLSFGDNRIDPSTGTLQVYGTVANPSGKFIPGARVRVRLPIGQPHDDLLVPETAILADMDKRYVLIVDEKNEVRRRNVELGILTDDGMRAITPVDELPTGENPAEWWVIVDNLQRVRLNYPVDPQKPAASTGKADS